MSESACSNTISVSNNEPQQQAPQAVASASLVEIPEEDLTCSICGDLFQAAVTIDKCGHSFCSYCIRLNFAQQSKGLRQNVTCPCCRAPLFPRSMNKADKILRANLLLQQQVFEFKQSSSLRERPILVEPRESTSPLRRSSRRSAQLQLEPPICAEAEEPEEIYQRNPQLPKLPVFHYQGKKRKDLIALLSRYNLPTHGTEDELKQRHIRFVLCWNGFCDEQVDPPTPATVMQHFRSSVLTSAARSSRNSLLLNHNNNTTKSTTSGNVEDARAELLRTHAKAFQELYAKIMEQYATKWCEQNFRLAIAAIQSNPIIKDAAFCNGLRQRAMNDDYRIRLKSILAGDASIPLQSNPAVSLNESPDPPPRVARVSQSPSTDAGGVPSPSTTTKRTSSTTLVAPTKRPRVSAPTPTTTSVRRMANPYRQNKSNGAPATNPYSKSTIIGAHPAVTNPYSKNRNHSTQSPATVPTSRYDVAVHRPLSTAQRPTLQLPRVANPYSKSENGKKPPPAPDSSLDSIARTNYEIDPISTSHTAMPPSTAGLNVNTSPVAVADAPSSATTAGSAALKPRNAVSPTNTAPAQFTRNRKKPTAKQPSWKWKCNICQYEMKLDRRATKCAYCGAPKGATFDDVFHNETNNNGSSGNPIEMC